MNKTLQHIKENTENIEAERMIKVSLTENKQIFCEFDNGDQNDKETFRGEILKIYLDKDGEAYAYDVYIY